MRRHTCAPRPNWQERIIEHGVNFSDDEGRHYWNESVYYQLSSAEVDHLEAATLELHQMCLSVVADLVARPLDDAAWDKWEIPAAFRAWVRSSWEKREPSLYGRFDLWFDGRDIKLLEYNADTPTGLIEAAVAQWHWMEDRFGREFDQFNSLHERFISSWAKLKSEHDILRVHFCSIPDGEEDFMTATYMRDLAQQAGLETVYLPIDRIGWNEDKAAFCDERERPIYWMWKLYPWEWLMRERFAPRILEAPTRWIEPAWKAILSNKALLVALWEKFPDHPLLLRAEWEAWGDTWVRKPILGREGANVLLRRDGRDISYSPGLYTGRAIYQELRELPQFDGNHVVVGSWIVGNSPTYAAGGIGIREADTLVTTDTSRFTPHIFS